QVLSIYDELYNYQDKIHHVLTAHEQGASHAADGYSRASGEVGVCIATSGPGATNLITGLATANADSIPMVAITGNVPMELIGTDSFQEVDTIGLTIPVTKHSFLVKKTEDLAHILREAFTVAKSGRPGPVLVDIPKNVQLAKADFEVKTKVEKLPIPTADENLLKEALKLIEEGKKPLIYCGGGVINANCHNELAALANKIDAYVSFSMMGLTAMDCDDPRYLGMSGMHGRYASTKAFTQTDLIIAAGVRFTERATGNKAKFASNAKIIHLDIDAAEHGKNIDATLQISGDLKEALIYLEKNTAQKDNPNWHEIMGEYKSKRKGFDTIEGCMLPWEVIYAVNEKAPADTIIATDVGQHQMWVAQYYNFKVPRTHLTSGGLGTMGYGMGAAIGGCMATGRKTVLFTGDGSFGMNLNEMATAVSQNLPLVVVILNNKMLGMIRQWQNLFFQKHYMATVLDRQTDFVKLAEAFGATGFRANNVAELTTALDEAFKINSPVVIECIIPDEENVFPMIP
ncbi:MAG: biosynthetic-type acetolactate synthase large subunit, partial [Anaerotignaceae bacterium]